jgi:hypothetical protein
MLLLCYAGQYVVGSLAAGGSVQGFSCISHLENTLSSRIIHGCHSYKERSDVQTQLNGPKQNVDPGIKCANRFWDFPG